MIIFAFLFIAFLIFIVNDISGKLPALRETSRSARNFPLCETSSFAVLLFRLRRTPGATTNLEKKYIHALRNFQFRSFTISPPANTWRCH